MHGALSNWWCKFFHGPFVIRRYFCDNKTLLVVRGHWSLSPTSFTDGYANCEVDVDLVDDQLKVRLSSVEIFFCSL